jgi:hypothetical protein
MKSIEYDGFELCQVCVPTGRENRISDIQVTVHAQANHTIATLLIQAVCTL